MDVTEVINKNAIDLYLQVDDKKGAIEVLSELLLKDGSIHCKEEFINDIYLREAQGMTGIGDYIAIPHGKSDSVVKTCIAVGRVHKGISWETIDDKPVKLIILFAVDNESKNNQHVKLMAKVAGALANKKVCEALLEAENPEDVLSIFKQY
jgi:PTS system fructose-specific IIA component